MDKLVVFNNILILTDVCWSLYANTWIFWGFPMIAGLLIAGHTLFILSILAGLYGWFKNKVLLLKLNAAGLLLFGLLQIALGSAYLGFLGSYLKYALQIPIYEALTVMAIVVGLYSALSAFLIVKLIHRATSLQEKSE